MWDTKMAARAWPLSAARHHRHGPETCFAEDVPAGPLPRAAERALGETCGGDNLILLKGTKDNAIVLLGRIHIQISENGLPPSRAMIEASQCRPRPIPPARISQCLTAEARDRPAISSLRLPAVLTVACRSDAGPEAGAARQEARATSSGACFLLTGPSCTPPCHLVRKARESSRTAVQPSWLGRRNPTESGLSQELFAPRGTGLRHFVRGPSCTRRPSLSRVGGPAAQPDGH